MFDKKCDCGAPATVQMNNDFFYCSQHAFEKIIGARGDEARKLRLRPAK
jgi:hypothetical protein